MAKKTKNQSTSAKRHRILIVDDHPVFREGLTKVVSQEDDFAVCGEADTAAEAFTKIGRLNPDLVITDIGLPGKSGLELIQDIHAANRELPVLVISMHDESLYAERVLRAGGRGYVMKQEGPEKMVRAIRRVLGGKVAVSEKIAAAILDALSRPGAQDGSAIVGKLSNREFEVLRLIGQGKASQDIAEALHLSIKTVDTHRGHIKTKLGLKNSTELVHYAVRWIGEQS
jgi:DNA-binding NarL/FixJ family response regulator